ncbi:hypothetical protein MFLAVUS_004897 [Mucor flavus]|uniref:LAGLIDADG endonuclease n=1 Tax=Mucor flavus TaxID=439312 RepID=A0ABP9YXB0_9FUNG
MNCSRDRALCILFGLEFTPGNVTKARNKVEIYGDLEVCYDSSERMMDITREKAICMLYCEEYSEENANRLLKIIDKIGLDICYQTNPLKSALAPISDCFAEPRIYKRYKPNKHIVK